MSDRHPAIYNEFDIEAARLAGQKYGARVERERILKILEEHGALKPHRWEHDAEIVALIKGESDLAAQALATLQRDLKKAQEGNN